MMVGGRKRTETGRQPDTQKEREGQKEERRKAGREAGEREFFINWFPLQIPATVRDGPGEGQEPGTKLESPRLSHHLLPFREHIRKKAEWPGFELGTPK